MLQPTPGKWYISVICESCKRRILLYPDLSDGLSDLKTSRLSVTCPNCKLTSAALAEHYLHPKKRTSGELTVS